VPASVGAQFANRDLYTLIIPSPDVAGYSGDWVLWFAERTGATEAGSRISAPVPAGKTSSNEGNVSVQGASITVQFAAIIDKSGHILSAKILRSKADPDARRRATEELATWDFKPALRNGVPIDVDVVLEIPLHLRADRLDHP
jgi:TonB family protein